MLVARPATVALGRSRDVRPWRGRSTTASSAKTITLCRSPLFSCLTASALNKDPSLAQFSGRVSDSGEGRWTIKAAIDEAVPAPVLTTALYERFSSRGEAMFQDKLLSAMRFEFGGHVEKKDGK